jgi:Family of unknown function (DUF6345)
MSMRLPVYELEPPQREPEKRLSSLAAELFGAERTQLAEPEGRTVARQDRVAVEQDHGSGGLFAADHERLRAPSERPALVSEGRAFSIADDLLERHELAPKLADAFALDRVGGGGTVVAISTDGKREERWLDVQARYEVTVRNPGIEGEPARLPLVGGGGKVAVTLGDEGRPLSFQGSWRQAAGERAVEALDRDEAHSRFAELTSGLEVSEVRSFLAYHAEPTGTEQQQLAPVWVFGGTVVADGARVPMRLVSVPATEFGPQLPEHPPQPVRTRKPGQLDLASPRGANPYEAGTSWIGKLGGLNGSQQNAKGFVDGLSGDGWHVNFNWGDANAWKSDWGRNDDTWVDAADFVFYTGHANKDGWVLTRPGTTHLEQLGPDVAGSAPATPGDRWGQQDLEWITVAACGPLQDDILATGGGDVLQRWDGAFDGLHILMGYGAITFDNEVEGAKLVKYAREGTPLIDAWFRTGQEVQRSDNGAAAPDGPTVWVGAMYVVKDGADPRFDHLWGHGPVAQDPRSPSTLVCMWTTC